MRQYLVYFDLVESGVSRGAFFDCLRSLGEASPVGERAWTVRSELEADEINEVLKAQQYQRDSLLIVEVAGDLAWNNLTSVGDDVPSRHLKEAKCRALEKRESKGKGPWREAA